MTHDYKRNGTATLFEALEVLQERFIGHRHKRHRHQEFIRFRRRWTRSFPARLRCISSWTTTASNGKPKPFVWTATVESVVAKLSGCRQTLEKILPGCTLPSTRKPGN